MSPPLHSTSKLQTCLDVYLLNCQTERIPNTFKLSKWRYVCNCTLHIVEHWKRIVYTQRLVNAFERFTISSSKQVHTCAFVRFACHIHAYMYNIFSALIQISRLSASIWKILTYKCTERGEHNYRFNLNWICTHTHVGNDCVVTEKRDRSADGQGDKVGAGRSTV